MGINGAKFLVHKRKEILSVKFLYEFFKYVIDVNL